MRIVRGTANKSLHITVILMASVPLAVPAALARVSTRAFGADSGDLPFVDTVPATPPVCGVSEAVAGTTVTSQQSSTTGQATPNASSEPKPSSNEGQKRNLNVNPLTGLVSTDASDYQPLTGHERWRLYWKMNFFSVGAYFGPFFNALLLDQATGSPAQWGGGLKGYGRRVASRTADAILQGTLQAPFAAALHEDVRYISSTQHGFKRRAVHAIVYSFLTYTDHGHPTVNIANLSAYYGSTAISTLWLPGHYNWASYALSNSTEQIALTMPVNLLQEFWPEIHRHVLHRP